MGWSGDNVQVDVEDNLGMNASPSEGSFDLQRLFSEEAFPSQLEPHSDHRESVGLGNTPHVTQLAGQPPEPEAERAVDDQDGVTGRKRKAVADVEPAETSKYRDRQPNWSQQEAKHLLHAKLDLLIRARSKDRRCRDPKWAHRTANLLFRKFNVDRSYKSIQQKRDSLLKEYKVIRKHNLTYPTAYYWDLSEEQRIRYGMPKKEFSWEIYKLMEILVVVEGAPLENQETEIEGNFAFQTEASVSEHLGDPSSSGRIYQPVLDSEGTNDTAPAVMEDQPLSPSLTKLVEELVHRRVEEALDRRVEEALDRRFPIGAVGAFDEYQCIF